MSSSAFQGGHRLHVTVASASLQLLSRASPTSRLVAVDPILKIFKNRLRQVFTHCKSRPGSYFSSQSATIDLGRIFKPPAFGCIFPGFSMSVLQGGLGVRCPLRKAALVSDVRCARRPWSDCNANVMSPRRSSCIDCRMPRQLRKKCQERPSALSLAAAGFAGAMSAPRFQRAVACFNVLLHCFSARQ